MLRKDKKNDPRFCGFWLDWHGWCQQPATDSGFCVEHIKKKCHCGAQAIGRCTMDSFSLLCGMPLCGECGCGTHKGSKATNPKSEDNPTWSDVWRAVAKNDTETHPQRPKSGSGS